MGFEMARLTTKGQVTIPKAVRERLNLKEGDRVVFFEDSGKIVIENAGMLALKRISDEVAPEIRGMQVTEDQVSEWLEKVRQEKWETIRKK